MLPVGVLMSEHRLIERMIKLLGLEEKRISGGGEIDTDFISASVDFIRIYTDKCHHGKEEAILFRDARKKSLSPELKKILDELYEDHTVGRSTTLMLNEANEKYKEGVGSAKDEISKHIKKLIDFYPKHIEKEDKQFFLQSMQYFTEKERDDMLEAFFKYDQGLIHDIYRHTVEMYEAKIK